MTLLLIIMILANILFILWLIDEVQLLVESVQLLFEQNEANDVLLNLKLDMRREKENE